MLTITALEIAKGDKRGVMEEDFQSETQKSWRVDLVCLDEFGSDVKLSD